MMVRTSRMRIGPPLVPANNHQRSLRVEPSLTTQAPTSETPENARSRCGHDIIRTVRSHIPSSIRNLSQSLLPPPRPAARSPSFCSHPGMVWLPGGDLQRTVTRRRLSSVQLCGEIEIPGRVQTYSRESDDLHS